MPPLINRQDSFLVDTVIKDVKRILDDFLNNDWNGAISQLEAKSSYHPYYSTFLSYLLSLKAGVTFDQSAIDSALSACHEAVAAAHGARRKRSLLTKLWSKPDYDSYTEDEVHAEGLYSASLCNLAGLTLITEKSFVGLIKSGYHIKLAFEALKECSQMSKLRTNWQSSWTRDNFEGALQLGLGLFNLIASLLPNRVLKLVQFLGFPADHSQGRELLKSSSESRALFAPISSLALLTFETVIEFTIGLGESDLLIVDDVLSRFTKQFPKSGLFALFDALNSLIKGNLEDAIKTFEGLESTMSEFVQFKNISNWYLVWCHAINSNWQQSVNYSKQLRLNCNWSPCVFNYQLATFLHMIDEDGRQGDNESAISKLLEEAPKLRQLIAGKTLFMEKFVTKRVEIYFDDDRTLFLPILEQFYFWNIFQMSRRCPAAMAPLLQRIESKLIQLEDTQGLTNHFADKRLYLIFFKGILLRSQSQLTEAVNCFEYVLARERQLELYPHLAPLATLELGLTLKELANYDSAIKFLTKTSNYSKYLNETLVHMRAHCAISAIKRIREAKVVKISEKLASCDLNQEVVNCN